MSSKPKFLVIGAGPGGYVLAKNLVDVADVTVLDRKDYLELNTAALRALVEPGFEDKVTVPYKDMKGIGRIVLGAAASMTTTSVTTASGETLSFDYAAICTGSTYSDAAGKGTAVLVADRRNELKVYRTKVLAAQSVIIVGGGPAGVEIAGEILTDCPNTKVTIINSQDRLLKYQNPRVSARAEKWLKSKGAEVILNQKAERASDTSVLLGGRPRNADLVIWCHKSTPNTDFIAGGELGSTLDEAGRVKVDAQLHVVGFSNLWAVGDCNNVAENKMAFLAEKQAEMIAANFKAMLKRRDAKQSAWKPGFLPFSVMMVSLGRKAGIMQLGWFVFGGWFIVMIKSKDMMLGMIKGQLGIKG